MHLNVHVVGPGNMLDLRLYKRDDSISGIICTVLSHYVANGGVKVSREVYYSHICTLGLHNKH